MNVSKKAAIIFGALGLIGGTAGTIALQTHAAGTSSSVTSQTIAGGKGGMWRGTPPAAIGSVTAVSGNTITVSDKRTGTSFTVDASSATIQKFTPPAAGATPATKPTPTTITVSQIAVGDNVMVQGSVSGTSIKATKITDGMFMRGIGMFGGHGPHGTMGTVASINGSTITLTGKNGQTYTIDASKASVNKVSKSDIGSIAVGDTLMVNGTTSGNSVTATNILDGVLPLK